MSELNARDKQELLWRSELVLAIEKLRNLPGMFEAVVEEFERALTALDANTAVSFVTFNTVMKAHRVVNGGSA